MNPYWTFVPSAVLGQQILNMFLVEPYMQMIPSGFENLRDTQTQHILNNHHWNFESDMCWWV